MAMERQLQDRASAARKGDPRATVYWVYTVVVMVIVACGGGDGNEPEGQVLLALRSVW